MSVLTFTLCVSPMLGTPILPFAPGELIPYSVFIFCYQLDLDLHRHVKTQAISFPEHMLLALLITPSSTYHWIREAFRTEVLQGLCFLQRSQSASSTPCYLKLSVPMAAYHEPAETKGTQK